MKETHRRKRALSQRKLSKTCKHLSSWRWYSIWLDQNVLMIENVNATCKRIHPYKITAVISFFHLSIFILLPYVIVQCFNGQAYHEEHVHIIIVPELESPVWSDENSEKGINHINHWFLRFSHIAHYQRDGQNIWKCCIDSSVEGDPPFFTKPWWSMDPLSWGRVWRVHTWVEERVEK